MSSASDSSASRTAAAALIVAPEVKPSMRARELSYNALVELKYSTVVYLRHNWLQIRYEYKWQAVRQCGVRNPPLRRKSMTADVSSSIFFSSSAVCCSCDSRTLFSSSAVWLRSRSSVVMRDAASASRFFAASSDSLSTVTSRRSDTCKWTGCWIQMLPYRS